MVVLDVILGLVGKYIGEAPNGCRSNQNVEKLIRRGQILSGASRSFLPEQFAPPIHDNNLEVEFAEAIYFDEGKQRI